MGGYIAAWKLLIPAQQEYLFQTVFWLGPFWLPFVFAGYALGRRTISWACALSFAISETMFFAIVWLMSH